ncbi:unnamed protein product [Cyclocybe aegerita]|uniref:Uncharacterized protein n=1 Tax=Cyclocybe aegerita TaxID=1973307 RepID=A0A8S0XSE4_CYCAE|nr:unnamed protein product [Cyclocybe aegerita]
MNANGDRVLTPLNASLTSPSNPPAPAVCKRALFPFEFTLALVFALLAGFRSSNPFYGLQQPCLHVFLMSSDSEATAATGVERTSLLGLGLGVVDLWTSEAVLAVLMDPMW